MFQFPVIYDTMTVAANLAFPLRNRGIAEPALSRRVAEVAEMLELLPLLDRRAANLTADEKQKISLGRGLVRDDVAAILFDEPLTVIDPHLKWQLRRKLKEVHTQFRHTLVYVTHDQNEALTFADRVVVMLDGEVVQLGSPQELFERPVHRFVGYFIGSPGMNFIACQPSGDGIGLTGTDIVLRGPWTDLAQRHGGRALELGIRPEFLGVADAPGQDTVQGAGGRGRGSRQLPPPDRPARPPFGQGEAPAGGGGVGRDGRPRDPAGLDAALRRPAAGRLSGEPGRACRRPPTTGPGFSFSRSS